LYLFDTPTACRPSGCSKSSTFYTSYGSADDPLPTMIGCSGTVSYANRATLCSPGYSPCSTDQYMKNRGKLVPGGIYWTNDKYYLTGTATACQVSTTSTTVGTICPGTTNNMAVCNAELDANNNVCKVTNCSFSGQTNVYLGGCTSLAGTMCCISSCPALVFSNAFATYSDDSRKYGSTATVACATSYQLPYPYTVPSWSCSYDGTWSSVNSAASSFSNSACSASPAGCTSGTIGQSYGANMTGCVGSVSFASSADLCSRPSFTPCTTSQYSLARLSTAPLNNYWVSTILRGTYQLANSKCFAVPGGASGVIKGLQPCGNTDSMRVCGADKDTQGNVCSNTNCSLTAGSTDYFGGCEDTSSYKAGALCCRVTCPAIDLPDGNPNDPNNPSNPNYPDNSNRTRGVQRFRPEPEFQSYFIVQHLLRVVQLFTCLNGHMPVNWSVVLRFVLCRYQRVQDPKRLSICQLPLPQLSGHTSVVYTLFRHQLGEAGSQCHVLH
jgi:hypothetical protein